MVAAFAESDRKTANATLQFRDIGSNPRKTRAANEPSVTKYGMQLPALSESPMGHVAQRIPVSQCHSTFVI